MGKKSRQLESLKVKMRTSLIRLGEGFGQLATVRGQTRYHLSPFEQRATAGMLSNGIPNTLWRIKSSIMYVVPPFLIGYVVYDTVEKEHDRLQRKQQDSLTMKHKKKEMNID